MKRKVGRPRKVTEFPSVNYKFILYDLVNKKNNKKVRMVGRDDAQVKRLSNFEKVKVKPTKVKDLVDEMGHTKANKFLKQFGEQWVCKNGNVFFKHS